jgi:rSAM/selenodomain-associated transferase 2
MKGKVCGAGHGRTVPPQKNKSRTFYPNFVNAICFGADRPTAYDGGMRTTNNGALVSVVIPTLNAGARLGACLDALVAPALGGLVREVIVVDGGSDDDTVAIADGFGATVIKTSPGRGGQLRAGAEAARGAWLLFLHGDTVLEEGWAEDVRMLIEKQIYEAGVFTLAFDADGLAPRLVALGAALRTRLSNLPYGDQGLLISKKLYEEAGGFADMPLMEDVEFIRRLLKREGEPAFVVFSSKAITSAARYERDGYMRRVFKNWWTLVRYLWGVSPDDLKRGYG